MSDDSAILIVVEQEYIKGCDLPREARRIMCRAYYRAMIAATPGLCVHEPDGTVRAPKVSDT